MLAFPRAQFSPAAGVLTINAGDRAVDGRSLAGNFGKAAEADGQTRKMTNRASIKNKKPLFIIMFEWESEDVL